MTFAMKQLHLAQTVRERTAIGIIIKVAIAVPMNSMLTLVLKQRCLNTADKATLNIFQRSPLSSDYQKQK